MEENTSLSKNLKGPFYCVNNCGKSYKNMAYMKYHVNYECGKEGRFVCLICYQKFKRKTHLKQHYIHRHRSLPDDANTRKQIY